MRARRLRGPVVAGFAALVVLLAPAACGGAGDGPAVAPEGRRTPSPSPAEGADVAETERGLSSAEEELEALDEDLREADEGIDQTDEADPGP